MKRIALLFLAPLAVGAPAAAQAMDPSMPGMKMPMPSAAPATHTSGASNHAKPKAKHKSRVHHAKANVGMGEMPGMAAMPGMSSSTPPARAVASNSMVGMNMSAAKGSGEPGMATMPGMSSSTSTARAVAPDKMADMPGMNMTAGATPNSMAGMKMSAPKGPGEPAMPNMPGMKDMGMPGGDAGAAHSDQATATMPEMVEADIPKSPGPPPPRDYAADRFYDPAAMAAARAELRKEHGGATLSKLMANLAEYQSRPGGGGYRWEGEGWIGGDINRFVVKSEGEGRRRGGLEAGEVQSLYSHAIDPYFDLQIGVRQDFAPRGRTYATVGFQGLAPYWFDVSGSLFLSTTGELLGRLESTYDLRLTQRLILQPRAELNFAAQNTIETRTGSGLSNAELGVRLRYEIKREFAPYIGVSWDRKLGKTADYAHARGEDVGGVTFVAGIRAFF
jgi:copper resistance protein B